MLSASDPLGITMHDLISSKQGATVITMLVDVHGFWRYDNREQLMQSTEEPEYEESEHEVPEVLEEEVEEDPDFY